MAKQFISSYIEKRGAAAQNEMNRELYDSAMELGEAIVAITDAINAPSAMSRSARAAQVAPAALLDEAREKARNAVGRLGGVEI